MKKFKELSEQHREKGRFHPVKPHNVASMAGVSPRQSSDSASVKLKEGKKDKYDEGEYDQEGDMAKSDLRSIIANAQKLHDMIDDADNLPEWCQNKITLAEDYISTVANYMTAEMNEEIKTVTVKHKTSGKELVVSPEKAKQLKPQGYRPVKEAKEVGDEQISQETPAGLVKKGNKTVVVKPLNQEAKNEVSKVDVPAYLRKQKGEKPLTMADVKAPRKDSISAKENLAKARNEEVEQIDEKNVPTSPEKWAQAKAQAKAKFDVYPSAYANGWAAKKYKAMGGGWKSVSEAKEEKPPFDPDPPRKQQVVAGKYGVGYSTARHLARMAMQKQSDKMKKPIKEESRKAAIVKNIMKKKKNSEDAFQKDPELSTTISKI